MRKLSEAPLAQVDVNLLGADVALSAMAFDVTGEQGTPLGDLICSVSSLSATLLLWSIC